MASFKILVVAVGLVFTLGLIDASAIPDQLNRKYNPGDEKEAAKREILGLLHRIQSLIVPDNNTDLEEENLECSCGGLQCTCCHRVSISVFGLNKECCLSVKYLKRNIGFLLTFKVGSDTMFSQEISAKDPIPICAGVPYVHKIGSVCIELSNIKYESGTVSGCTRIQVSLAFITILKIKLGCFTIKFGGEMEPVNALELPSYYWIDPQHKAAIPVFKEHIQPIFQELELK